jgi:hypothetical protein
MYTAIIQNRSFETPVDPSLLDEFQLGDMCFHTSNVEEIVAKARSLRKLSIDG